MYQWEDRKCGAAGAVVWASKALAVECSCAKMFAVFCSFLLAVFNFHCSPPFAFSDRYLHHTRYTYRQDTLIIHVHLVPVPSCMQGMWAPHTVCTFARCPLLSTDLLRIENKTHWDQISNFNFNENPTLWKPPYVFMYVLPLLL